MPIAPRCTRRPGASGTRQEISSPAMKSGASGVPVEKLEAAVDAVVIGDADEIHAARLGDAIDVVRRRIALARAQPVKVTRVARVIRVHVEIGLHDIASERLEKEEL